MCLSPPHLVVQFIYLGSPHISQLAIVGGLVNVQCAQLHDIPPPTLPPPTAPAAAVDPPSPAYDVCLEVGGEGAEIIEKIFKN